MYHSDHLSEGKEDPGRQLAFLLEALLMVLDDFFEHDLIFCSLSLKITLKSRDFCFARRQVREEAGRAIITAHVAPGIKSR